MYLFAIVFLLEYRAFLKVEKKSAKGMNNPEQFLCLGEYSPHSCVRMLSVVLEKKEKMVNDGWKVPAG